MMQSWWIKRDHDNDFFVSLMFFLFAIINSVQVESVKTLCVCVSECISPRIPFLFPKETGEYVCKDDM